MSKTLLRPHQPLIHTKYFTSRISSPREKVGRQSTYLDALGTLADISIIYGKYGKYSRDKEIECNVCGSKTYRAQEKMTDVNIAVSLLEDAYQDAFDTALLISGDSDLCPPLRTILRLFPHKRILVAFPPSRVSTDLRQSCSATLHISAEKIKKNQLPDCITKSGGYKIERPAHQSYPIPIVAPVISAAEIALAMPVDPPNSTPKLPPGYRR